MRSGQRSRSLIGKILGVFAERGFWGGLRHLLGRALGRLGRFRPSAIRWRRERKKKDDAFDREHGVDTGGTVELSTLNIGSEHRAFGVSYLGVDPEEFQRGFSRLPIRPEEFVFVDLGSGKGRALLLASALPFRRIVGVEFASELHRIAQENVVRYRSPTQRCRTFELVCMDAASYELPDEPVVIFLYNPFGPEVMEKVAARVRASYAQRPREIVILYANSFQLAVWEKLGFSRVAAGDLYAILKP